MIQDTGIAYLHAIELPTPFPVGPVSVFLSDAPGEHLTLVDTGPLHPDTRTALMDGLAQLGYGPADLERIVVTHAHVDHFGLARDLADTSGAEVWTHPWNVAALGNFVADREERVRFYGQLLSEAAVPLEVMQAVGSITAGMTAFSRPVAVTRTLDEGATVRLAGRDWQVLHTPGHASGLICLYEPESGTLLSSDHLLAGISSNPVVEPPPPGETERPRSLVLYRQSLRRVAAMGLSVALPSHGPAIYDIAGLVAKRMAFHERRLERVVEALRAGAQTTWEVTELLFPGRPPLDTFLAVSEVVGHLDVLEIEGRIAAERRGGSLAWRPLA